jgi:predicted aldo/keto reductase-like oxidoreductase
MLHRRLGRSELRVSVVGFGTCQLRMVTEQQAIDTLKRGFELGVNIVHTAPDYEGADDLVAQAIGERGAPVTVATQGYGDRAHFEWLFESACRKFGRAGRLDLFGIACVDDRERLGENIWGQGGMVEFLHQKKREGRLRATFCTTHGTPDYIRGLAQSDAFDALMVAYNPAGFHLLSSRPDVTRPAESLFENSTLFDWLASRDIGVMIMKPLAGGLLCDPKAFPPYDSLVPSGSRPLARDVLRHILTTHPAVTCVLPGTASIDEADENARAGHAPLDADVPPGPSVQTIAESLPRSICSHCGYCDTICSQGLPVSWLLRDADISATRSMTFETPPGLHYFELHPSSSVTCSTCPDITCSCPFGLDVPAALIHAHERMLRLAELGVLPVHAKQTPRVSPFAARLISREVPARLRSGETGVLRLVVENSGTQSWVPWSASGAPAMEVSLNGEMVAHRRLRQEIPPGERCHLTCAVGPRQPSASTAQLVAELVAPANRNEPSSRRIPLGQWPLALG